MAGSTYHERIVNASKLNTNTNANKIDTDININKKNIEIPPIATEPVIVAKVEQDVSQSAPVVTPTPTVAAVSSVLQSSLIHHGTVRSGQQLYADGRSLVIVGSVNNGAEVLADGDIHVYGSLMGRAVAGLGGSSDSHIFAKSFGASLVGISDAFVIPDDCSELNVLTGKEAYVRLLKETDNVTDLKRNGAQVVDCGSGNSLVVAPM